MKFTVARSASVGILLLITGCHTSGNGGGHAGGSGSGGDMGAAGGATGDLGGTLAIAPLDQVITIAPGAMTPEIDYTASINGASVAPTWSIDRGEIGQIAVATGVFLPGGSVGGTANITATFDGQTVTTTVTVKIAQTQNGDPDYPPPPDAGAGGYGGVGGSGPAGGASPGQTTTVTGTPLPPDPAVHILYPYDGTVWPRGLLAPLIAWDPTAGHSFDAVLLKLHEANFDYSGTFAANATPFVNMIIPQAVWKTLLNSNKGKGDDVAVSLTFEDTHTSPPTALGPYTMTWHIAAGTLEGTVYYNSYGTALVVDPANPSHVGNSGEPSCNGDATGECCDPGHTGCGATVRHGPDFGAATLSIKANQTAPTVVAGTYSADKGGCRVCHTVSANGGTLLTQHGDNYDVSELFNLTAKTQTDPTAGTGHNFPALSPDGTWFMSGSGALLNGDSTSRAYSSAGTLLATQPTIPWTSFQADMPVFSPDGKHLSFNYQSSTMGSNPPTTDGKSLAILDYDATMIAFTGFRILDTPMSGVDVWSSFLPTSDAVVYEHEISSPTFGFTWQGATGELMWTPTSTPMPVKLAQLNGAGYLPSYAAHTGSVDATLNFEPTVNPVVSGGYAWIVFTSRRLYGNVATIAPVNSDPRLYDWQHTVSPKKLWVAAIDLNAPAGSDPSHPAFYLPGQELRAGNSRGYWTVDPCRMDGSMCETGDQCCGGFCRPDPNGGSGLVCTMQQPSCSQEYEKCTQTSDCCGAMQGISCINGLCVNPIS